MKQLTLNARLVAGLMMLADKNNRRPFTQYFHINAEGYVTATDGNRVIMAEPVIPAGEVLDRSVSLRIDPVRLKGATHVTFNFETSIALIHYSPDNAQPCAFETFGSSYPDMKRVIPREVLPSQLPSAYQAKLINDGSKAFGCRSIIVQQVSISADPAPHNTLLKLTPIAWGNGRLKDIIKELGCTSAAYYLMPVDQRY